MQRVTILIDGGYLRAIAKPIYRYNPDFIEKVVQNIVRKDEQLFRTFYYDCDPYKGTMRLPVSGQERTYDNDGWLNILAAKDSFAVRCRKISCKIKIRTSWTRPQTSAFPAHHVDRFSFS